MKKINFVKVMLAILLFMMGVYSAQAQLMTRFGFLDEFDDDVIHNVWDFTWNTKYTVSELNGVLSIDVTNENEWDGFGLKPANIGKSWNLSGATIKIKINSEIQFKLNMQPNGVWNDHVEFTVMPGENVYIASFPATANTKDVSEIAVNFRNTVAPKTGNVKIDYIAIGTGVDAIEKKTNGLMDDFEDGVLYEIWDFTWNTKYAAVEDNGILQITTASTADWEGFGIKPINAGYTLNLDAKTIKFRLKSDISFSLIIQPSYSYDDRVTFAITPSTTFQTYEASFPASGSASTDITKVDEISVNFNGMSADGVVEFEYFAMGSYVEDAEIANQVFFDDFDDDVIPTDDPWSTYDEGNYSFSEDNNIFTVTDNKASTWAGFGLKFLESPMDFSNNAVVSFRARTTTVDNMVIKFGDVDGNWDQWGTAGHPQITLDKSGQFVTYSIDIASTMESGVDVYDLSKINEISIYFDVNQTGTGDVVEFDWFSIGQEAPANDRLQTQMGQNYFANGMNLAWLSYGGTELIDWTSYEANYINALDEMAFYGVNSIRWWLHTHTVNTPLFDETGMCTGIQPEALVAIKKALDLAQERGITVNLVLFTHNLFKSNAGEANFQRNYDLVTDPVFTQAYIDNALIPMVENIKGHPALMCWEVMNEPEYANFDNPIPDGMVQPTKEEKQQFFNLIAGAIHRTDVSANVTVGMGQFQNIANWCSDAALIAAGGDADGTLDFYKGHFYGGGTNPFTTNPTDMGINDKPVVIGEFSPLTEGGGTVAGVPADPYTYAYNNGYAGIMAWKYFETPGDNTGSFSDHKLLIESFMATNPTDIEIDFGDVNSTPYAKKALPLFLAHPKEADWDTIYAKLDTIFFDKEDGTDLVFTIGDNSDPTVAEATIVNSNELNINVKANAGGECLITIIATDKEGKAGDTQLRIYGVDPSNLSLGKSVKSSTKESDDKAASNAVDGNPITRWASDLGGTNGNAQDDEWLIIDLGADYDIGRMAILWENAYGKNYNIVYASNSESATTWNILIDGDLATFSLTLWHVASTIENSDGAWDEILFSGDDVFTARYIGFQGIERVNTEWGYSIFEIEVNEVDKYDVTFEILGNGNAPLSGAAVEFNDEQLVTDNSGLAVFENVLPSETPYAYTITHNDYEDASGTVTVDSDETEQVTLTLTTYDVTFVIRGDGDALLIDATVNFNGEEKVTTSSGEVVFEDVIPSATPYAYTITHDQYNDAAGNVTVDSNKTENVTMTLKVGFKVFSEKGISIYPNPTNGFISLSSSDSFIIEVIDMTGKVLIIKEKHGEIEIIDLSNQPSGLYFLRLRNSNTVLFRKIRKN